MENETFQVFEWRIENISYWDTNIHGVCITSPQSSGLDHVRQLDLHSRWIDGKNDILVIFHPGNATPSSGGNLSLLGPEGSLICTKRTHTAEWNNTICCNLTFADIVAKMKSKKDTLILRLSFLSSTGNVDLVSTTLAFLKVSISIDLLSLKNMESGDSKNISIIHYNKENYLDEMLLKADRNDERIKLILELLTMSGKRVSVESQWRLQSSDGTITKNEENNDHIFQTGDSWVVSNLMLSELTEKDMSVLLDLKIFCGNKIENRIETTFKEIGTVPKKTVCFFDQKSIAINDPANKGRDSSSALKSDLMRLLKDQELSDLTLKCGDVTYPVHRVILGARSPVFKSMLTCNMREAASGLVDIGDLDPSTLSRFLTFLYTETAEDLQCESALNLYYAAEKYQVPSLKSECADFLCSKVSFSNVCDILSFADKHGDEVLAKVSNDFLLENYNEVLRSKEWKSFAEDEPSLALKTLCRLGEQNYVGKIQ